MKKITSKLLFTAIILCFSFTNHIENVAYFSIKKENSELKTKIKFQKKYLNYILMKNASSNQLPKMIQVNNLIQNHLILKINGTNAVIDFESSIEKKDFYIVSLSSKNLTKNIKSITFETDLLKDNKHHNQFEFNILLYSKNRIFKMTKERNSITAKY